VSIILDGENAWEYYPDNAYGFLQGMYRRIADSPELRLSTCSEAMTRSVARESLDSIFPGSWINGNYGIWIGHQE
jgi:alpha-amylase/alpha-mannosidase (GH57 family)